MLLVDTDVRRPRLHASTGVQRQGGIRNLILGEDFSRAVRGISEELGGARIAGFAMRGEIALDVGDMSGFHNTTRVVLAFPET